MDKIAVCIPSFNESQNIATITKKIDDALSKLDKNYESLIINADNNSKDDTNKIFNSIKTKHQKISLLTSKIGKGINILNFLNYVKDNKIKYAITIDADLKSFEQDWLIKMISKLEAGYDFVCPLYYRRKEEGNVTNHFALPILYSVYGKFIRQPIGGDYAFNSKFVNKILTQNFDENILKYGIDIFLVVFAIVNKLNITEVDLGKKIHGTSYQKMSDIFESVLRGFIEIFKKYPVKLSKENINYTLYNIDDAPWEHLEEAKELYKYILINYSEYSYEDIRVVYNGLLFKLINDLPNITDDFINNIKNIFIVMVLKFWEKKDINWEEEIIKNVRLLGENYGNKNS